MSCCRTPTPTRERVEREGPYWVVRSTCSTCGTERRESPYADDEDTARHMLESRNLTRQRIKQGGSPDGT